ncbi:hypothetical protein RJ639_020557 [Escallonia herrerae]|uniref:Uncharacterized protein n=1 Tax=Escallonia herrerae TaxID=1293975 RepID=A0AA88V922_9ASTE|nr:hypothetical protein RJ639_020557 [Escallonia herrerae]
MALAPLPPPFPVTSRSNRRDRHFRLATATSPHRRLVKLPTPSAAGREVDAFTKYSDYLFELGASEAESPTEYDISKIESVYRKNPLIVLRRLFQIGTTFGKWFALRYLDKVRERSDLMFEGHDVTILNDVYQNAKMCTTALPSVSLAQVRAAQLRDILVQLGPAYIKIAQVISSRPDLIPPSYLGELSPSQDRIAPFFTEEAFNTIEKELGLPIEELFSKISPAPVAAASLGQVYQARLRSGGQLVAVKVQRPGVQAAISLDILILRYLAGLIRRAGKFNTDLQAVVDEWASNHPGHLLVPIKLNGTNYPSWSKSMIHALTAKNKIGFINGSIEQPSEKDQPTEYALWNQCNSMILSWLTHSVEPDLAKGVIHAKTAYQVCEDFKDQFSQKNAPDIYQIQKSLASFSQGTMTVSTYFTKLKGLWDELDTYRALPTCNQMKAHDEQREEDRLMQFLMGLHDTYNIVHSSQSTHGVHSQDTNSSPGLSTDQLQQLAHALSMMTQNQKSPGNSDAYANAAGLGYGEDDWLGRDVKFSETIFPFMSAAHPTSTLSYISPDFMDNWQSSPSLPTNIPSSQPQPTDPTTIQESASSIQSPLAEPMAPEDISPNPTQPLTSSPPAQSAEPISTSPDSIIPSSPPRANPFGPSLFREMNYKNEASNGLRFRQLYGDLQDVLVPEMYVAQTTRRVLTMQWLEVFSTSYAAP